MLLCGGRARQGNRYASSARDYQASLPTNGGQDTDLASNQVGTDPVRVYFRAVRGAATTKNKENQERQGDGAQDRAQHDEQVHPRLEKSSQKIEIQTYPRTTTTDEETKGTHVNRIPQQARMMPKLTNIIF